MTTPYLFISTQSVDTQSIQTSRLGTSPQLQPFQVNQLPLLMVGGGLILAMVLVFHGRRGKRMMARSRRNAAPVDWYQAEFDCGPLAADTTIELPLSTPVEPPPLSQSAPEQPASEQSDQVESQPVFDALSPNSSCEEAASTSQRANPPSLSDRYSTFIDQIITDTLKGRIRSKNYVYDRLVEELQPRTGEIFERCLVERVNTIQHQLNCEADELKQAKAGRQARGIVNLTDVNQN